LRRLRSLGRLSISRSRWATKIGSLPGTRGPDVAWAGFGSALSIHRCPRHHRHVCVDSSRPGGSSIGTLTPPANWAVSLAGLSLSQRPLPFRRRPCFDCDMPVHVLPPAARFWLAWNETAFHAGITIALRSSRLATAVWTQNALPANGCWRMVGEKQLAMIEAVAAAWIALPRGDPYSVAAAALRPYRRRARANARRLSRRSR
jgi:hypothetical protein